MEKKSYFSTNTPLSNINYILPNKHAQYILKPCNDIFTYARRNRYEENIDMWLNKPFLSDYQRYNDDSVWNHDYGEEDDYEEDDYQDGEYDENINNDDYEEAFNESDREQPINNDVIEKLYDEVISVVYGNGYELDDTNLFKEDLIYFIYRLSKI